MSVTYPNRARALRERLLAQRAPPPTAIVIGEETFHIRTPVLSDRDAISRLALGDLRVGKDGSVAASDVPLDRMQAAAALTLAVDETGAQVFEPSDFDTIRAAPIGSWMEQLANACLQRLNPKLDTGEAPGGLPAPASTSSSQTA